MFAFVLFLIIFCITNQKPSW
ncbi:BnaC09g17500D [Brassica napus]|uniref:BnaC09g17500D protein n=1 Tax=Brassica napus TaxID=3708 RepID=A0A078I1E4_BRANA|nr:BnaC09g17500D [Brassica napus]